MLQCLLYSKHLQFSYYNKVLHYIIVVEMHKLPHQHPHMHMYTHRHTLILNGAKCSRR